MAIWPHDKLAHFGRVALGTSVALFVLVFSLAAGPGSAKKTNELAQYVTSPVRLAITPHGELLVTDYQSQAVLVIDPLSSRLIKKFEVNGRPTGIDGSGKLIYVGNETSGNVEVYSRQGKLLTTIGDGAIDLPNDVAVDPVAGQLFVVDSKARKVLVYNEEGLQTGEIPAPGVAEALASPTAIAIDPDAQLVYVSDQGPSVNSLGFSNLDARVRIYRYNGTHVTTLSGNISRPQGLTINADGYLYLVDGMLGQVLVFDLISKALVTTIGSNGMGPGQLSLPLDVAINPENRDLWVANNRAGRLELFVGGGVAP